MALVLVIEDDRRVVELLQDALTRWGHEVVVARNGEEGYEKIATRARDFDVILCDLHLGEMSGKALLDRVGAMIRGHTPVIVMSGLAHMLEALGETRQWAFSMLAKPFDIDHLRQTLDRALDQRTLLGLLREREDTIEDLQQRLEFLVRQNLELFRAVRRDALTHLPTRQQLSDDLGALQARAASYETVAVLCLVDLDGFRRFNDEGGYEAGDRALERVAEALRGRCRDVDRVYRWGGDEFVVLIPCERIADGAAVMQRLGEAVKAAEPLGATHPVTLSAGVAGVQGGADQSLRRLIAEANDHLRRAKAGGGDGVAGNLTQTPA